jgi:D-glycero-D-manno-heptose 1,7-bisphosphate phosphatase
LGELRPAVFLDRDGTLIEDCGYLRDRQQVCLLAGAAEALRDLQAAGFALVVVTNQSGVARGYLDEIALTAIHNRLRQLLAAGGAMLDGLYYCPYYPQAVVDAYRKESDWRKPGSGMLLQAATDLGIDLRRSWMIGDSPRDIQAGRGAGCRTVLLGQGQGEDGGADAVAADLPEASRIVLRASKAAGTVQVEHMETEQPIGQTGQPGQPGDGSLECGRAAPDGPAQLARIERHLERIVEHMHQARREEETREFGLSHIFAALAQVIAIAAMLGAVLALLKTQVDRGLAALSLMGAIAMQGLALTLFMLKRRH